MSKKKTHAEYVAELAVKNPDIEVVGIYMGNKVKIPHRCKIHEIIWDAAPNNTLNGCGCSECKKEKSANKRTKTHEEYVSELSMKNRTIRVVEKYKGANINITHYCLVHDVFWDIAPTRALSGCGCPQCHSERLGENKKKTHEQYVKELYDINPNIQVLENYIDSKTSILHKCLIDNFEWKTSPASIINNKTGCPKCAGNIKKNHEQYVYELSTANPYVEPIEDYVGANFAIMHKCKIHNVEWKIAPSSVLQGHGCPQCKIERSGAGKNKKTNEQYVNELKKANPNIIALEEYIDSKTPILHKCLIDNFEWMALPSNTVRGSRCPECNRRERMETNRKTHDEYVKEVKIINPNIQVCGEYVNAKTPILHKCLIDDFEWSPVPSSILRGYGCPICGIKKNVENRRKSQDEYIKEANLSNPDVEIIGEYISISTPIEHRCKIHNLTYETMPYNVLHGSGGCPKCTESKGERKIRQWIEKNNIDYIYQYKYEDCKDGKTLPFDFYLPKYNILIEYDGEQHFKSIEYFGGETAFRLIQKHDAIKNEYCKNNGISLLRIPYYKYNNIEEELNNFLFI